ncbi:MAG: PAS domain-containing protein [Gammaproteobacteria bacterium]|nr:PAS domain-containing protein [Gammaproteobacteria bacterium]
MPDSLTPLQDIARLRLEAEERLRNGTAPFARASTVSADALGVLYRLASVPDTAGEGLKLLHELQTYQVEVDMQHEQLVANERESAHDLACYRALYDMAPCGLFILGVDGCITNCNAAGARLFGGEKNELCGRHIDSLMTETSRPKLTAMLARVRGGRADAALIVTSNSVHSGLRSLRLVANLSPDGQAVLMVVTVYDNSEPVP